MATPAVPRQRPAAELAREAMDSVGRDPAAALILADAAAVAARRAADPMAAATAHRAAALALRELGDLAHAERRARAAVRAAARTGNPLLAAEPRMTLAFILLEAGRVRAALGEAEQAAAGSTGLSAARVASQRALILQRMGRLDEALAGYAAALPVFRRHRDHVWEARLLNNRGQLHTDQGRLTLATADFAASRAVFLDAGMTALASDVEWNLAGVATLRGDVPMALARFDAVRSEHLGRGTPNPQLQIDRAETLLSVGLAAEAVVEAAAAVTALTDARQHVDLPHAILVQAQAYTAIGDHEAAGISARRARLLFQRQNRPGWATLSALTALRAAEMAGHDDQRLMIAALRSADEVRQAGWPLAEMDARLIAARAAARLGNEPVRRAQLELASDNRRLGTVDARLRGWYAQALLRDARGDRRGVQTALAAAMHVLDQHQALLGATELRANLSTVGAGVVHKGLEIALAGGRAREVLRWADLGRARATRPRPVRPPQDEALTSALAAVRRLHARTVQAQLDGSTLPAAGDRRRAERDVVAASRRSAGQIDRSSAAATSPALVAALGDRILVEFVEHDELLYLVAVADGRFTLHPLGSVDGLDGDVAQLHFATRRLATGFGTIRARTSIREALRVAADDLGQRLLGPVSSLGDDRELVIVPSASLHGVLWTLLDSLWRRPFVVAPSAAAWLEADSRRCPGRTTDRTDPTAGVRRTPPVLVAGPGLPAADAEVTVLAAQLPDAVVLRHPHATVAAVLAALDGTPLAHIAAHGALRTDNPLFSALLMDDGPLTIYDIEGLRTAPEVVLLPSCESGVSSARAGDELLGLVAALLSIGTRTVIATALETPDHATGTLMVMLHRSLGHGDRPAAALAHAREAVDPADLVLWATAAGFTCFGG
ncbi:MAG: CHAT domain-containing protein [Nakamurella sp.]